MEVEPIASTSRIPEPKATFRAPLKKLPLVSLAQGNPKRPVLFTPDAKLVVVKVAKKYIAKICRHFRLCFVASAASVKIYNAATCQHLSSLTPAVLEEEARLGMHDKMVTSLLLHPANPLQLVTGSLDGYVRVWDYLEGQLLRTMDIGYPVTALIAHHLNAGYIYVATTGEIDVRKVHAHECEMAGIPVRKALS